MPTAVMRLLHSVMRMRWMQRLLRRPGQETEPAPSRAAIELTAARNFLEAHEIERAEQACHALLDIYPDHLDGLNLTFRIALKRRHYTAALRYLENGMRLRPDSADLPFMHGYLQIKNGNMEAAIACLKKSLALDPRSAKAGTGLGTALQTVGRHDEALRHFQSALEFDPSFWRASYHIGNMTKLYGRFADAVAPFQHALRARRSLDATASNIDFDDPLVTRSKLRHDLDQLEYLARRGLLDARVKAAPQALREALLTTGLEFGKPVSQTPAAVKGALAPYYNRLTNFYNAPALPHGAINQNQDWEAIAAAYFGNGPGMAHFDNFLKPEALHSLRKFCLESTIWFDFPDAGGYVSCACEDGFICPLLAQVAEETRLALRKVFANHRLTGLRGYKYDSEQSDTLLHGDSAAVNVNFWLAPEAANLSPESGGLVVWDKEAPPEWDFEEYNSKPEQIDKFLRASEAQPYVVPHRQNRVVLFNSNLFHRNDEYRFQPGYENRRIDVTMLYGARQATGVSN